LAVAPLTVAVPLLAAGCLTMFATRVNRRQGVVIALAAALAVTTFCVILLARTASGLEVYWFGGWHPRAGIAIGVAFTIDAIGAGLATLISVLMVAALALMWRYRDSDSPHFQVLMLLFLTGMVGFCLSGDLFNMFVFFELMSVAAFALAGYKVEEAEALEGSLNFAVTNTIGSFLVLTGIALVYGRTGALNLAQIGEGLSAGGVDGLVVVAFALLVGGFLIKAAVVPFHFWLADAYAVAPTPVCLLFAGAMSELGIYAVGRIWFDSFAGVLGSHAEALRAVLIVAGSATALIGAMMCFGQDHLRRMLAFATIAYVGLFLIGLGLLTPVGVAGAAIYVVADGFGKAALFGAVAIVQHRRRRVSERRLWGRGRGLPYTGLLFVLGALSFAAVPPFGTFFGKSLIEDELIKEGYGGVIAVLILASALTSGAVLRAAGRVFLGWGTASARPASPVDETEPEEEGPPGRTPALMFVPTVALIAAALAIGVVPGTVDAAQSAAGRFIAGPSYAHTVLAGTPPAPVASPPPYSAPAHSYLYAALTFAASVGFAALALFGCPLRASRARSAQRLGGRLYASLRDLHSGHVGDYVAWLVAGVAALGGAFAIAFA
jgi:multicomponent Na+:H+ antiporter subunit D